MMTDDLNDIIDDRMKKMGITKYTVDGMKLNKGNYVVSEEEGLIYDQILDVYVRPIEATENITMNIILTKKGFKY